MQTLKSLILLIAGFVAGYNANSYFARHATHAAQLTAVQTTVQEKKVSVELEQHFQNRLDSMQQTNILLGRQVAQTKTQLQKAKTDKLVLEQLVDTLIAHENVITDTATKLAACDSLEITVADLIAASIERDSLCDTLASSLQQQVSNKDSTLSVRQEAYNALRLSFDNSLAQQDMLNAQTSLLQKQLRQHIVKNRLVSAGAFILSTITAYSLLRH